jgi:hypothetical protein
MGLAAFANVAGGAVTIVKTCLELFLTFGGSESSAYKSGEQSQGFAEGSEVQRRDDM